MVDHTRLIVDDVDWRFRPWDKISRDEAHDLLRLRSQIFVVEQQDPYNDIDGNDPQALHLRGYTEGQLFCNGRLIMPGVARDEAVIGRLCVNKLFRGQGVCKAMIVQMLRHLLAEAPGCDAYLYMQTYWMQWLLSVGAVPISAPMSKSRIEHVEMLVKNDVMKELVNDKSIQP